MKFTAEQKRWWQDYEVVRESGVTNMFAVSVVSELSGLTREEVMFVMKNYSELKEAVKRS